MRKKYNFIEYQITINSCINSTNCRAYLARVIIAPAKFSTDFRPTMSVATTFNALEAISGNIKTMKEMCKFINKVAPHFEAKVVWFI